MSYEIVFIDADDTLYDYTRCESFALHHAFEEHHIEAGSETMTESYRRINQQLWNDFEKGRVTLEVLRLERFARLFAEFGLTVDAGQFSVTYLSYLAQGSFLIEGAEELCSYLQAKYRLVIVTNGIKEVQLLRIAGSPLNNCFEAVIVSEDAGYQKPHTGIFDYACGKLNFRHKPNAIMIGDSLSSDIQGGMNYGIDTCWYNPKHKDNPAGIQPTYTIHRLQELKAIL